MLRFELINSKDMDGYINNKNALIIDIRDKEIYEKGHIKGAINIPMDDLEMDYSMMPKNMILVLYCESGGTSILAAKELFDIGYVSRALLGGIKEYSGKYFVS